MKVPNYDSAIVPIQKIEAYLLNIDHPDGASKARFFLHAGYDIDLLREALIRHIEEFEFAFAEENLFGTKYVIDGEIQGPNGDAFHLRSVWIVINEEDFPVLITAYPIKL